MIEALIDKQDGFEIVRDQIAAILVSEIANQQALAIAGGKDPDLWKIRIFLERSNGWEQWLNEQADTTPICNIWYDTTTFPKGTGNVVQRQKSETVYNLDLIGYGRSANDESGGHTPGDREASLEVQRAVKLVRNILMHSNYVHLGLQGTVWQKWIQSIRILQPEYNSQAIQKVMAARIALQVDFNELSPEVAFETLEYISTTISRSETGEVYLQADYDYS